LLKLQDSEIGSLLEGVRDAMIVAEASTGRIVYWNPAASEVFGYSPAEALRVNVEELVPGLLKARQWAKLSDYRETGHDRYIESEAVLDLTAVPKGGEEISVELTLSPIELTGDLGTRGQFLLAIVRDVTERKRAEEMLRKSEASLAHAHRMAHLGSWDTGPLQNELSWTEQPMSWSDEMYRILGFAPQEFVPTFEKIVDSTHPQDLERVARAVFNFMIKGEASLEIEHRVVRPDGEVRDVHARVESVFEENGEPVRKFGTVLDITERKQAEVPSRESHALLHSIIEGAAEAVFLKDAQGRYVIVNSTSVEIVGKPAEEILGKKDADLYPPEVADSLVEVDRRVMDTGETITLEESLPVAGAMRTYLSTKTPYRDHRGDVTGVIGVSTDITERKLVEEELEDQEILLETTFNQAADALVVCDARGRFTFINPAARRMALMDPEGTTLEVAPEVWGTAYSSDGHRIPWEEWPTAKALRGETTVGRETRMVRPDGSHYDLLISAAPLMNREGQIVGAVGDCLDITERKKAEEQLREAERRYRTLIEQIPAITYVQEPSEPSRTTYISPQMEAVLGYSPQECLGDSEHWIKIMHPADRERVLAEDRRTNETGEPFSMEYRQFTKDGRVVWLRDEASLVRDEEGNPSYWLGVQTDTTEYKRAEEMLQEAEARYRTLVEQIPAVTYIQEIEHEGAISYISPQIEEIMGYPAHEYINDPDLWVRTIHPDDRERVLAEDRRTDRTGEPFSMEFRKVRRDGRVIWVRDEAKKVLAVASGPGPVERVEGLCALAQRLELEADPETVQAEREELERAWAIVKDRGV
jgi:PAS domain S-box-containing protein